MFKRSSIMTMVARQKKWTDGTRSLGLLAPIFAFHKLNLREALPDPASPKAHSSSAFPSVCHAFNKDKDLVKTC